MGLSPKLDAVRKQERKKAGRHQKEREKSRCRREDVEGREAVEEGKRRGKREKKRIIGL